MRISRRKFLTYSGLAAAWAVAGGLPTIAGRATLAPYALDHAALQEASQGDAGTARAPVAVARGADYAARLAAAIERLGGPRLIAAPGERIVVKPALAWNAAPGQGVNVDPEVLQAVLALALVAGAGSVLVFDRTACRSDLAYRASAAEQVVARLGDPRVQLVHLTEADFVPLADAVRGTSQPAAPVGAYQACRFLLEADRVINLAVVRHHPTRQVALGMANLLGLVGGDPADPEWARRRAAEPAVLAAMIQPELTILDATNVVVRNGPLGHGLCDLARLDTLVVGRDPVAVESYGARLFASAAGLSDAIDLPHISLAEQLGVGTASLAGRVIELEEV